MNSIELEALKKRYLFALELKRENQQRLQNLDELIKQYEEKLKEYGIDIEEMKKKWINVKVVNGITNYIGAL